MDNNRIFLSTPVITGFEKDYIFNASNWLSVNGSNIQEFENEIENYLNDDKFVAVLNSGTSAMHLALVLLGVQNDDEVLCQSMTFAATANPIIYCGAKPIFIDSEKDTWNICPDALEKAIKERISKGKKPKAIIAVDLYGMPFKYDEIKAISIKYEIPIIEDSAEAFGSSYENKKCGTLGDISIFSFNGNKILSASGGGAIVVNSSTLKEKAIYLSTQARDKEPFYQHSVLGYNYRMNNLTAGIGLGQLKGFEKLFMLRQEVHNFYKDCFLNIPDVELFELKDSKYITNYWLNTILLAEFEQREKLRLAFEKNNIETRPLWKPMHLQPFFKDSMYFGGTVSEELFKKGLCLPSSSNLNHFEKVRIKNVLHDFF